MSIKDQWDLLAVLPFIAGIAGLAYVAVIGFGGTALRLRRKQKAREEAARRNAAAPAPWNAWLREINEGVERGKRDDVDNLRD